MKILINNLFRILGFLVIIKSLSGFYFLSPLPDMNESVSGSSYIVIEGLFELLTLTIGFCFIFQKIGKVTDVLLKNTIFSLLIYLIILFIIKTAYKHGLSLYGLLWMIFALVGMMVGILGRIELKKQSAIQQS